MCDKKNRYTLWCLLLAIVMYSFTNMQHHYTTEELTGKGTPNFSGKGYQLQPAAHEAFLQMQQEAKKAGIHFKVVSSYRSYDHQKRIWERKFKTFTSNGLTPFQAINKIVEYSTIPGTSRHHWGTDIDIVDGNAPQPKNLLLEEHFQNDGPFCKLKEWMDQNAEKFGFYLVYTDDINRKGFKYEPWHYSYAPISIPMLSEYRKLDIPEFLRTSELSGNNVMNTSFINSYITNNVFDINPKLQ